MLLPGLVAPWDACRLWPGSDGLDLMQRRAGKAEVQVCEAGGGGENGATTAPPANAARRRTALPALLAMQIGQRLSKHVMRLSHCEVAWLDMVACFGMFT